MEPVTIRKILAPTDYSEHACCALKYAREFADKWGAEIHILNVIEPTVFPSESGLTPMGVINLDADLVTASEHSMHDFRERPEFAGFTDLVTTIRHGQASGQIISYAEEEDIDLIVISTHGRKGLEHLIFGSTAERVVRESPCPVLTVRPKEAE